MKALLIALTLAFATTSCFAEIAKTPTPAKQEVKVEEKKTELVPAEKKEPETKRVCVKILDNKTNKEVEKCRTMKIHQKYVGTSVPTK